MKTTQRLAWFALLGLLTLGTACAPAANGPRIRVATATAQQLADAEQEDHVWYEFQQGDVIPVVFAFLGVSEGGARQPVVFRAKQHFWFVTSKNGPMQISFDGKTFADQRAIQSMIAVVPRKDGQGGQLGWIIYMGEGNPEAELKALIEQQRSGGAQ
ncbi:MAG: hypothetical protein KC766_14815 [Myxococcales bacterium]|nr:hypothetical protein [Myxococcales bacterium]